MPRKRKSLQAEDDSILEESSSTNNITMTQDVLTSLLTTIQQSQAEFCNQLLREVRSSTPHVTSVDTTPIMKSTANFAKCSSRFGGGSEESVENFIDAIKVYKACLQISDENALLGMSMLLTSLAGTWWQGVKNTTKTWDEALTRLRSAFGERRPPFRIYGELFSLVQGKENTDLFIAKVRALLAKLPQGDLCERVELDMTFGLLDRRIRKRLDRSMVSTFDELLTKARAIEDSLKESKHSQSAPQKSSSGRDEVTATRAAADEPARAAAVKPARAAAAEPARAAAASSSASRAYGADRRTADSTRSTGGKMKMFCVYCKRNGHTKDNCEKLNNVDSNLKSDIKCYGCGAANVIKSKCAKCNPKDGSYGKHTAFYSLTSSNECRAPPSCVESSRMPRDSDYDSSNERRAIYVPPPQAPAPPLTPRGSVMFDGAPARSNAERCKVRVLPVKLITPLAPPEQERALPPDPVPPKPPEPFRTEESFVFEKPLFVPAKPIPYSPKISPSSIPNPNPSVMTPKQVDGYPNYGSYLYSIPGYSAFQPISSVSYPSVIQQAPSAVQNESSNPEFMPGSTIPQDTITTPTTEEKSTDMDPPKEIPKPQTDFEEHFTTEIVTTTSISDVNTIQNSESKMSITSLAQGSGATVTIPSQIPNMELKKKPERFSLKTSIPISKIDMKCVSNPPDAAFQNSLAKKTFIPPFPKETPRVEIQSNIVIKTATKEPEAQETKPSVPPNNSISTLINAAEAINKTDNLFRIPEPKVDTPAEEKDSATLPRPLFNPINIETSKVNLTKPPEPSYNEQKNQIVFIQNKNNTNPKMLLTIQQQNPQVLLQRTNFEIQNSKNLQAPSRLLSQSKKCKEDVVNESTSSKVVALKRLHQENCDENDFENLITENQIYGNKIVVKEKSQGTLQEQDLKNKKVTEKVTTTETKNVVLQPNFVYLSNVQFPANLMMIKNNSKVTQTTESCNKIKIAPKENKAVNEITTVNVPNIETSFENKTPKPNAIVSKDIQVLKSNNNGLQPLSNKTKPDIVIQANQKVIVTNPQIVYQVPISSIVEGDKISQPFKKRDYPTFIAPKKDPPKKPKTNDKLYIACPYQMDSKLQPKIVITNIRPKINKIEDFSALDNYEKRKRMRRLKYLSNRDSKDVKIDTKKVEKTEIRNIVTPDKVKNEIYKEFANTKAGVDDSSSGSDTDDYGEEELKVYEDIIEEYGSKADKEEEKVEFMANLRLATPQAYKEKDLELQDKVLRNDAVASAYAAVGRLDMLLNVPPGQEAVIEAVDKDILLEDSHQENRTATQRKKLFLSKLKLTQVTQKYKEGYEKAWMEILNERKRRNSNTDAEENYCKQARLGFDANCQLRLLTEIKKCVNENNNLIKKRLDSVSNTDSNDESIKVLAEKNFSELNRLSKMADTSVKLFKAPSLKKRDLNPGFDSENIKKTNIKLDKPYENYPKIKIPTVSKIISLKSTQECPTTTSTQATSMDEPQNSAAGVTEMFEEAASSGRTRDASCQVEIPLWSDVETLAKSYNEYDAARRKEIADLHKRNTALKIEGAHITRSASRDSDHARALLAERQNLSIEENNLRMSLQRIRQAIDVIRNY